MPSFSSAAFRWSPERFTRTKTSPPIPYQIETQDGQELFNRSQVKEGQAVFQKNNLMGYGTLLGNGSYYGPDYTAEVLDWVKEEAKKAHNAGPNGDQSPSPNILKDMVQSSE